MPTNFDHHDAVVRSHLSAELDPHLGAARRRFAATLAAATLAAAETAREPLQPTLQTLSPAWRSPAWRWIGGTLAAAAGVALAAGLWLGLPGPESAPPQVADDGGPAAVTTQAPEAAATPVRLDERWQSRDLGTFVDADGRPVRAIGPAAVAGDAIPKRRRQRRPRGGSAELPRARSTRRFADPRSADAVLFPLTETTMFTRINKKTILTAAVAAACLPLTAMAQDRPQPPRRPAPPPQVFRIPAGRVETAPQTYLGVSLTPVGPELAAHLGKDVPQGVGLGVAFVDPDGPAKSAGVERYDVITKLDDQWVINADQFTTLVRMRKADDKAKLTVERQGEQKVLDVSFAEKDLPVRQAAPENFFGGDNGPGVRGFAAPGGPDGGPDGGPPLPPEFGRMMRDMPNMQNMQDVPQMNGDLEQAMRQLQNALRQQQNFGAPRPEQMMPGGITEGATVTMSDGKTTSTLTNTNGNVNLHIEDGDGKALYDGPYPDEAKMKTLSPEVRQKVEQFQKFVGPQAGGHSPSTQPAGDDGREKVRA